MQSCAMNIFYCFSLWAQAGATAVHTLVHVSRSLFLGTEGTTLLFLGYQLSQFSVALGSCFFKIDRQGAYTTISFVTLECPIRTVKIRGVKPFVVVWLIAAPRFNSNCVTLRCPVCVSKISGVAPPLLNWFIYPSV